MTDPMHTTPNPTTRSSTGDERRTRGRRPLGILASVALTVALLGGPAQAGTGADGVNTFVDRLSGRIATSLAAPAEGEAFRALDAPGEGDRLTVNGVVLARCDERQRCTLKIDVAQPGSGPRLLLVDAGAVFRGPGGADLVAVPNQRFVVEKSQATLDVEALPIWPKRPLPPENTALKAAASNDPGLIAVLRSVQRIESEDVARLRRYVKDTGGTLSVETFLDNEDVRAARWMTWYRDAAGQIQGRYPRDAIQFAIYAVTSGYTINEVADWYRSIEKLDMNPAIAAAGEAARKVETVLERAGLNYRVFSPNHADYHLNRGVRAFRNGDLDAAEKAFKMAIDKQNTLVAAHYNLGITLYRKGKYEDAEAAFQVAIGLPDAPAEAFYNRGAALFRNGDKLGAARMFRRALDLNPRDPEAGPWLEKADPENKTRPAAPPAGKPGKKGKK
jgi:tetratricopeptide (TPR) repeat protein